MVHPFRLEDILPDVAVGTVLLPRRQEGSSPQNTLVTLLADYSLRTRAWVPSAAIVALLVETGVTVAAARTALSRLSRRGVLDTNRQGRATAYRLAAPAAFGLAHGGREIATFARAAEDWDHTWTLVAFSLPEGASAQRRALRGRLRWMGYMPLYDALWVAPHPTSPQEAAILASLSQGAVTMFRAQHLDVSCGAGRRPLDAWDLAVVTDYYTEFVARWRAVLPEVEAGSFDGATAIRLRTEVMDTYRRFVVLDPRLPMADMPPGWPRPAAYEVFVAVYDGLAAVALAHVLAVVARNDGRPQPDIRSHTVAELAAGLGALAAAGG